MVSYLSLDTLPEPTTAKRVAAAFAARPHGGVSQIGQTANASYDR